MKLDHFAFSFRLLVRKDSIGEAKLTILTFDFSHGPNFEHRQSTPVRYQLNAICYPLFRQYCVEFSRGLAVIILFIFVGRWRFSPI